MASTDNKVSEVVFDLLQLEIINHIKSQHEIQPYLDAGIDPVQAGFIIQRLIRDKLLFMGASVGQRLTLRIIDGGYSSLINGSSVTNASSPATINTTQLSSLSSLLSTLPTTSTAVKSINLLVENTPYRIIAKDLWAVLFSKAADQCTMSFPLNNNQTNANNNNNNNNNNNYGNFVTIKEASFRWTSRFSPFSSSTSSSSTSPNTINTSNNNGLTHNTSSNLSTIDILDDNDIIRPYIWFTAGIIKGGLHAMGIEADVIEEVEVKNHQIIVIFKIFELEGAVHSI